MISILSPNSMMSGKITKIKLMCYNKVMANEVVIAIISLISALVVAVFGFLGQVILNRKKDAEERIKEAKKQQYQDDRDDYFDAQIAKINKKLDEHNHYAKKFEEVNIKLTKLETILTERASNAKSKRKS